MCDYWERYHLSLHGVVHYAAIDVYSMVFKWKNSDSHRVNPNAISPLTLSLFHARIRSLTCPGIPLEKTEDTETCVCVCV